MPVSSPISPAVDHLADLALWEAELAADPPGMALALAGGSRGCPTRASRGAADTGWWWSWC